MISLKSAAWHQITGRLINQLDDKNFWLIFVNQLKKAIHFDSWVILLFSNKSPLAFAESPAADGEKDALFNQYLQGFYLLDPFYIHNREKLSSGLFLLNEVIPEHFEKTDYFQYYFSLNIVTDELQLNYQIDLERTLCLSLGSKTSFTMEQIATIELIQPWVLALMKQRFYFEEHMLAKPSLTSYLGNNFLDDIQKLLTCREFEVSCLLLSGYSSKEISKKLNITSETVRAHRKHIYSKLGIHSQAELFSHFLPKNKL